MKALKVIGILLLVILGIGLIASLVLPKNVEVSESVVIDAPIDAVWSNVSTWEKTNAWSPWNELDPDMKVTYEGEPGTLESKYSWEGNKDVGSGYQTFKVIDADGHHIESQVFFKEPWEGNGDVSIDLQAEEANENQTKVTWTYKSHVGIPGNLFSALFNAKGMLSEAYSKGLGMLKVIAEEEHKNKPVEPTYAVRVEQRAAMNYCTKKDTMKIAEMQTYFPQNMPAMATAFQTAKLEMAGIPSALYWDWDEEKGETILSVAIPVKGDKVPKGYNLYKSEAGEALIIDYYGPYEGIGGAHEAMESYMKKNGREFRGEVAIEEYVTDPQSEPDQSKWLTRVIYPVKPIAAEGDDSDDGEDEE